MELRVRNPSPLEPLEPYIGFLGWPLTWFFPYGIWTWGLLFAPEIVLRVVKSAITRAPLVVKARRDGDRVALLRADGSGFDTIAASEIETMTLVANARGAPDHIRFERKHGRTLLFDAWDPEQKAHVGRALGVDLDAARSRYRAQSRAFSLIWIALLGTAATMCGVWLSHDASIARLSAGAFRLIVYPMFVLVAVPTWLDVGRDGVAWRWLMRRRYEPMSRFVPEKLQGAVSAIALNIGDDHVTFVFRKEQEAAPRHIIDAWAASRDGAKADPESTIARPADESIESWIDRMRASSTIAGTYRGPPAARMWEVVEDTNAPLQSRIGALLVVTHSDESRTRVRALATQIVSPELRALFEAIAAAEPTTKIASLFSRC